MDNVKFGVLEIPTVIVTICGKQFVAKEVLEAMRAYFNGGEMNTPKGLMAKLKKLKCIKNSYPEVEEKFWDLMQLVRDKIAAVAAEKGG